MTSVEVAVIIPTLNEERFIESCLQSVINQSYPFERMDVMVVDGGSSDRTCEVVEKFHMQYPNIRLLRNEKRIQSVAFNIGVKSSRAPYVVRLDAHVRYDVNYIELCIKHLKNIDGVGNVGGYCNIQPQNSSLQARANAVLNTSRFGIGGASFRVGAKAGFVDTVPFGAFPRSVIEQVGLMREDLARGEDNEYNSRIRKNGYKIYFDPEIRCAYYARATVGASVKQMYSNGLSIGHLFYVDRQSVGIRHIVPLLFVLSIAFTLISSLFCPYMLYLLAAILLTYTVVNIFATILECIKNSWIYIFILPWLFFLIHISYGCGTIVGLIKSKQ